MSEPNSETMIAMLDRVCPYWRNTYRNAHDAIAMLGNPTLNLTYSQWLQTDAGQAHATTKARKDAQVPLGRPKWSREYELGEEARFNFVEDAATVYGFCRRMTRLERQERDRIRRRLRDISTGDFDGTPAAVDHDE